MLDYENDFIEFDVADKALADRNTLEMIGVKILEGQASNEDYSTVRNLAAEYMPGEMFKFSPRLMSREASLESIETLKRYAGTGVAVAIVLALIALIDRLFGSDSDSSGGGGSRADKASKNLEEAKKQYEESAKRFTELQETLKKANSAMDMTAQEFKELKSQDTPMEKKRSKSGYKRIERVIKQQSPNLTDEQVDKAVKDVIALATASAKFLGLEEDPKALKPFLEKGLDIHFVVSNKVFLDGRNKWARISFLSESGFTPSNEIGNLKIAIEEIQKLFHSHREQVDKLIQVLEKDLDADTKAFSMYFVKELEDYGVDVDKGDITSNSIDVSNKDAIISEQRVAELTTILKARFDYLEPNQVVAKNVLSKIYGADQEAVLKELENFDDITSMARNLGKWMQKSEGVGTIPETIERLTQLTEQLQTKINNNLTTAKRAIRLLQSTSKVAGKVIAMAGNFEIQTERVSVQVLNFAKLYGEVAAAAERLEKYERGASNESYQEDPPCFDPSTDVDDIILNSNNEAGLPMHEVHIPSHVILPHGIDRDSLRELVEDDASNWTRHELDSFIETAQVSLESLYTDMHQVELIHQRIQRTGLICRSDVMELEAIHPGLITSQTPIGRFTSFESVNHARPSLEAAGSLAAGAQVAAGIAAVAILAKILQWCYKRFQASRDVTKSIKGSVDVIGKINDQNIALVTGLNGRVEALKPDMRGKLNDESKKHYSDKGYGNSWYNIQDVEKSMMELRIEVFAKNHEKSYSELIDSIIAGNDGFKLIQVLTTACEKGAATLEKAVDNVSVQIDHLKDGKANNGSTDFNFKGLDYGLDNFRIKDLDLSKTEGNVGRSELVTTYIQTKKDEKLSKEKLKQVEIDKMVARLGELATKLKEVNGRVDSDFKKIQQRLEKLEKSNAAAAEKDSSDGSVTASREAIKSYIKSVQAEFNAYSKFVGAHSAILKILDAEIKKYGSTLKDWGALVSWQSKRVSSLSKETGE